MATLSPSSYRQMILKKLRKESIPIASKMYVKRRLQAPTGRLLITPGRLQTAAGPPQTTPGTAADRC